MSKILVLGNSGSGKSSFSSALGKKLGICYMHLDAVVYLKSWDTPHFKEMESKVNVLMEKDTWIIDGNFLNNALDRFDKCDTIFFLDINRFTCLYSVLKRTIMYKGKHRESRNDNCDERITKSYLKWVFFDYYKTSRKKIINIIENSKDKKIVVFKNRRQINKYLKGLVI